MASSKQYIAILVTVLTIGTLLLSCQLPPLLGTPTPTPQPLAPRVIQVAPERGEELQVNAPIQVVFDQPMDKSSVEEAFTIEPRVSGTLVWVTDRAVQILGGHGYIREHPVELWMRNGRGIATFTGLALI